MARAFSGANDEFLWNTTAVVTAPPFTAAGWFRAANVTDDDIIFGLGNVAGSRFELYTNGAAAGDPLSYVVSDGTTSQVNTTTGYSANVWHHGCIIEAATNNRAVLLDGGSKGTNSDTRTPSGVDDTALGASGRLTNEFTGRLAEWAVWNAALTDAEVATLALGVSPLLIRPNNLVAYWPLIRDEDRDRVGGFHMTPSGSPTVADHPPKIRPYWFIPCTFKIPAQVNVTKYPGTAATSGATAPYDDKDWQNPDNAKADDAAHATCTLPSTDTGTVYPNNTLITAAIAPYDDQEWDDKTGVGADDSDTASITDKNFDTPDISYLAKAQGLGLSIPSGATITGLEVKIERWCGAGGAVDACVQLLDANGDLQGDNKADTVTAWPGTESVATYGGTGDTWGVSLTPAMVNDPDFGVGLAVQAASPNADIFVDYIQVKIWYTGPDLDNGEYSYLLKLSNFGFSIPENNGIDGVKLELERKATGTIKDAFVKLLDASGDPQGDNKADTVTAWPGTDTIKEYGGSTDKWGATLTRAIVNDVDFGVAIAIKSEEDNSCGYIDFARLTIWYSETGITVIPGIAVATAAMISPGVVLGSTTATPGPAASIGTALDPVVVLGSISITPGLVAAVGALIDPSVQVGDIIVTPGPAEAPGELLNPTVILGSVSVTPGLAGALCALLDPSVVLGSITITPGLASAIGQALDPGVIHGSITITPAIAEALCAAVSPSVILGSTTATPAEAAAIGALLDPNVIVGGDLFITPEAATALCVLLDPNVVISGGEVLVWLAMNLPWTFGAGGWRLKEE